MYEEGDIRNFNPDKELSKEVTLAVIVRHRDVMQQARSGELVGVPMDKISDNDRKFNQVRVLSLLISTQREMITISRPIIKYRSIQKWKKSHKSDEDQVKFPFEQYECDYNKLIKILELLKACEQDIIEADRTKNVVDDFVKKEDGYDGEKFYLTQNFFEMVEELENSYEEIYSLMLVNKIVSAGIQEDEELTYKQKEQEAVRRVVEA